jgi:hypothetical protein
LNGDLSTVKMMPPENAGNLEGCEFKYPALYYSDNLSECGRK